MIMRNANAIRAIAAWHFSKRTAGGGSYVNTFNFLVWPLYHVYVCVYELASSVQASTHTCIPFWPFACGPTVAYLTDTRLKYERFYLWLCAYYPWLITGSSCVFLFAYFFHLLLVACILRLAFFVLFFIWVSSFWPLSVIFVTLCWLIVGQLKGF